MVGGERERYRYGEWLGILQGRVGNGCGGRGVWEKVQGARMLLTGRADLYADEESVFMSFRDGGFVGLSVSRWGGVGDEACGRGSGAGEADLAHGQEFHNDVGFRVEGDGLIGC